MGSAALTRRNLVRIGALAVLGALAFSVSFFVLRGTVVVTSASVLLEDQPFLVFTYLADRDATVTLIDPAGRTVDSVTVTPGRTSARLRLAPPYETPQPGTYTLRAERFWRTVGEWRLEFRGADLRMSAVVSEWGWDWTENRAVIEGMKIAIHNQGDLPAYVDGLWASIGGVHLGTLENLGLWIGPGDTEQLSWELYSPPLASGIQMLKLKALDPQGNVIGETWQFGQPQVHGTLIAVPDFPLLRFQPVDGWRAHVRHMPRPPGAPPTWWLVDVWIAKPIRTKLHGWVLTDVAVGGPG